LLEKANTIRGELLAGKSSDTLKTDSLTASKDSLSTPKDTTKSLLEAIKEKKDTSKKATENTSAEQFKKTPFVSIMYPSDDNEKRLAKGEQLDWY
jgi:hypothetical protein